MFCQNQREGDEEHGLGSSDRSTQTYESISGEIAIQKLRKTVEKNEGQMKGEILRACHKIGRSKTTGALKMNIFSWQRRKSIFS
jgi:IMP dehydrogenase/GMP reductase